MRSRIYRRLCRLGDRLGRACGQSALLDALCGVYPKWEAAFGSGCFRLLGDEEKSRDDWQFRLRERMRPGFEAGLFGRITESLLQGFFRAPICLHALFWGAFAVLSLLLRWWFTAWVPTEETLLSSLGAVLLVLPARTHRHSLGTACEGSLLLGEVYKDLFCLDDGRVRTGKRGVRPTLIVLLMSLAAAWLSLLWTVHGLLLLLLAGLGFLLILHAPELGILLVVGGFPLLQLTSHPTAVLLALALLTELSFFAKALVGRRMLRFGLVDGLVLLLATCYFGAAMLGAGGREGVFAGVGRSFLVLFWFPVRNLLGQKRWRMRILRTASFTALLTAAIGIYQYFFCDLEIQWVDRLRFSDIGGRVVSTFTNPNILAVYLLTMIPICLAVLLTRGRRRYFGVLGGASLCAVLLCIVLTWTRGAWLASPIALFFFLLLCSRRTLAGGMLALAPLFSLLPWLPQSVVNRFVSIGRLTDSSVSYRLYTWRGSLRLIAAYPWGIGAGERAFSRIYPRLAVSGTESVPHTHHLFLQVTAELGVAGGLVLLLFLLVLLFAVCFGLWRTHGEGRVSLLAGACGILGTLVLGLFDYIWYQPAMMLLFFFSAGVSVAVVEPSLREHHHH